MAISIKRDPDSAERRIVIGLSKIGLTLRSIMWAKGQTSGLTPTQAQILAVLDSRGPLRVSAIATDLGVRQPTATEAVSALVRKGYVSKSLDSNDRRAVILMLTTEGQAAARQTASWPEAMLGAAGELDAAEQAALLRGLTKIIRTLQERGEIAPCRICVTCRYFCPHAYADPAAPHRCALVDAAFGDRDLRMDCAEHEPAPAEQAKLSWQRFAKEAAASVRALGRGS
ncbi:MAG: MarR family winged helix-turn-helix transcriptional regulator [Alphaproteobacteria bacterium]